jgi:tetratricopeptide (TPR) repeat protein
VANIHRDRGNLPAARAALADALRFAERSADATAIGRVYHGLLAVEHVAGNLTEALRYGWKAVETYPTEADRVQGLASLAGALVDAGQLKAAEDAWTLVSHLSTDDYYRLYAHDALGHVAALRGDRSTFAARAAEADAMGWESGPHAAKAEILYYRGLSYRALGERAVAMAWLERAVAFAEEHRFNRTLFEAEGALASLGQEPDRHVTARTASPAWIPEVSKGLRAMRLELVGSNR